MPYLSCADCCLRIFRSGASASRPCPSCGRDLIVNHGGRPDPPPSIFLERRLPRARAPVTKLLDLQKRIATRIRGGGSLADVEREIIASSALDQVQLPALRLYASGLLRAARLNGSPPLSS